ncbi:SIR2 family NAD-dependent protein deacylase [Aureivirga sp. CE67]|uniref:SIR2 family NAD-dependent protein deacylase n=1 Tax=Aureivirga sp. CE67 TaxID=1788983 RepID=UPI0018C9D076|nr:NAD-dependent deacylase [Aureivirga sp. CE67]
MKKRLVILTGAGISAESGLKTFRDSDGLWENYKIEDVASIEGWQKNPSLVLEFYNARRKQAGEAKPNKAHEVLAELEKDFDVHIITQNVDDLHERAGSSNVLHLHGKLREAKSSLYPKTIVDIGTNPIKIGDVCDKGAQLRPNIVWFGEDVPEIENAALKCIKADIFVVIGTSLQVYPAANLINYIDGKCPLFVIDPHIEKGILPSNVNLIQENAVSGVEKLKEALKSLE